MVNQHNLNALLKPSPDTTVTWYRNSILVKPSTDYQIDFNRNTGISTLKIAEAYPEDSGQYTCTATNPGGDESSTAWLVVRDAPMKVEYQIIETTQPKTVKTFVTAKDEKWVPKPLNLGNIESTKVIEKTYITETVTTAAPRYGDRPEFLVPLENVEAVEGGQAVFQCILQGKQPMKIQWYRGDKEITPQYRYKTSYDSNSGTCKLIISPTLDEDAGPYSCSATNDIGQAVSTANLIPIDTKSIQT